jgi:hypothetical protein
MAMRYYAPFPGSDGEPPRPRGGPHALRIGDAERDAAAADLGEHYAAGRLSLAVFASKTFGQLTRVLADLPGPGRLRWRAGPGRTSAGWGPAGFPADGPFGMGDRPWHGPRSSMVGFQTKGPQAPPTPTDRAGRFAALSLLLLAMLIWLFTALLFARHGFYHTGGPYGPPGSYSHFVHGGIQPGGPGSPLGP